MGLFSQRKEIRLGWLVFRWCRIVIWFALFLVVVALAYLHLVGLPDFLKPPLLEKIRQRGFEARFTSARLGWGPAILIENAAFSPTNRATGPKLSAALTEVSLNWAALLHFHLRADAVDVLNGQVRLPDSDRYGRSLSLNGVHMRMQLFSNDVAQLTGFGATFRGVRIRIDGEVTNFAAMSGWKLPVQWEAPPHETNAGAAPPIRDIIEKMHFSRNSRLDIHLSADGRDINTLRAEAMFMAPFIETPWISTAAVQMRAAAAHLLDVTNRPFMQARLVADRISTRWGTAEEMTLMAAFYPDASTPFNALLNLTGENVDAKWNSPQGAEWVRAGRISWEGQAALLRTNFKPAALEGTLRLTQGDSRWGSASNFSLTLKAAQLDDMAPISTNWGVWTRFAPYKLSCHLDATNVQSPQLKFETLAMDAMWRAPQLEIENLQSHLYQGGLSGRAGLDIDSRQLHVNAAADFDPRGISHLLAPSVQRWFSEYSWEKPPSVSADVRLILPAWTNRAEGWQKDVRASLQMAGDFSVGAASFRKVDVTSANASFSYTNGVWHVPRLEAKRPDGSCAVDYTANEATREFHVILDSQLNPADIASWLEPKHQQMLRELSFSSPPEIHCDVRGEWRAPAITALTGTVAASNFTARGESIDEARAGIEYTNHFVRVTGLEVLQGRGRLDVPLATMDFDSGRLFVTNAQSTLNPRVFLTALSTNAPDFLSLVRFDSAPTVRASGSFVVGDPQATDMQFDVQGEGFHWTNFGADKISGDVRWTGPNVVVTNVAARLYNTGTMGGWLAVDSAPGRGEGFRTDFTLRNIDLNLLTLGLTGKSNRVEGKLDGYLALEAPVAANKATWTGHGDVHIHDARLWDIKIFGVLSPLLNAMSPGLGDSRARQASALFSIANDRITSDDLEIHSTGMRLLYRGSVDMHQQVNGRVEADVLRDTPLFGSFLSAALLPLSKLFEYQITGPLQKPVFKPLYVPKFVMLFLRPFHSLKALLPEAPPNGPTNAPPANAPAEGTKEQP